MGIQINNKTGIITAAFSGDGSALTALSANNLTSGTIPDARFPATLPAASGVNLTALNATQLTSGTVPLARLSASSGSAAGTMSAAHFSLVNGATDAATNNTLVKRNEVGNISAGVGNFSSGIQAGPGIALGDHIQFINDGNDLAIQTTGLTTFSGDGVNFAGGFAYVDTNGGAMFGDQWHFLNSDGSAQIGQTSVNTDGAFTCNGLTTVGGGASFADNAVTIESSQISNLDGNNNWSINNTTGHAVFNDVAATGVLGVEGNIQGSTNLSVFGSGTFADGLISLNGDGTASFDSYVTAFGFIGEGSQITALNATQLTSGTIPNGRFPATLPAASGVNLTALNATQLTSGTVPVARLSASSGSAAGTMSAAHFMAVNGATTAATANTLVKRDSAGNIVQHDGFEDSLRLNPDGSAMFAYGQVSIAANGTVNFPNGMNVDVDGAGHFYSVDAGGTTIAHDGSIYVNTDMALIGSDGSASFQGAITAAQYQGTGSLVSINDAAGNNGVFVEYGTTDAERVDVKLRGDTPVSLYYEPIDSGYALNLNLVSISITGQMNLTGTLYSADGGYFSGGLEATTLYTSGTATAGAFYGDGSGLTALNATQLTSGTIPNGRFPATLPAASGANLTSLNATQLTSGTVPLARLSASSGSAAGTMSSSHFSLVNGATTTAAVSTLVKRDTAGNIVQYDGTDDRIRLDANGTGMFGTGSISLNADGSAYFAGNYIQFMSTGEAVFQDGNIGIGTFGNGVSLGGDGAASFAAGQTVFNGDGTADIGGYIQVHKDGENRTVLYLVVNTYANNAAALSDGMLAGQVYKTATGELRIVV